MRWLVVLLVLASLLGGCNQGDEISGPILEASQPSREQLEQQIAKLEWQSRLEDESVRKAAAATGERQRALLDYMGWLASAAPMCDRVPWLCGSQLATQSRAAATQGWPVRPGLSLLLAVATALLWGLMGLVLWWLGIRFVGPARREVEAAEQVLEHASARQAAEQEELAALAQRVTALRQAAQTTSKEVIAQRKVRDDLIEEIARLHARIVDDRAELERVRRQRDALL
jgi:cell division protein FtsB